MRIEIETEYIGWHCDVQVQHGGINERGTMVRGDGLSVPYHLIGGKRYRLDLDPANYGVAETFTDAADAFERAAKSLDQRFPIRECGWCGSFIPFNGAAEHRHMEEYGCMAWLHPECSQLLAAIED